jgi:microcystin-dependent protein
MARRKGRATTEVIGVAPVNFPTGCVLPYAGTTAPEGWLLCDGDAVSRTDYAALFAVVSTAHGIGDGATTFNIPDYRYQTPRGVGGFADKTFLPAAVNIATEEIAITDHVINRTGFRVRFTTTGTLPTGLAINTTYYAIVVTKDVIKLATTRANAILGTAINLTGVGSGVHTLVQWEGPDASSRTSTNGGLSGDNVGSMQEDVNKSHRHVIVGANTAGGTGVGNYLGAINVQGGVNINALLSANLDGENETRVNNQNANFIIKV